MKFSKSNISAGPLYLTVSSSGEAGEVWYPEMGVYSQSGHYHNNKMVWARHDGTRKLFYTTCKSIKGGWIQIRKNIGKID